MRVFIDPACNIVYASYYIHGLFESYGRSAVGFSASPFKDLQKGNGREDFDHYFAFILDDGKRRVNIAVDFRDKGHLNLSALQWADVYGKVNYNQAEINAAAISPADERKLLRVGPNFGVKLWSKTGTATQLFLNYLRCGFSPGVSRKLYMHSYRWLYGRADMNEYLPTASEDGYVFFISTLWKNDKDSDELNRLRGSFIRACKLYCPRFEGGLFTTDPTAGGEYADILTDKYIHHTEFTGKIKRSMVVFNTPAVWACHGWKLGEFLAMGKAIISTPFHNEMPVALEHGKNIHFVKNELELEDAVKRISTDKAYRELLEAGARSYFQEYLQPAVIIRKLLEKAS